MLRDYKFTVPVYFILAVGTVVMTSILTPYLYSWAAQVFENAAAGVSYLGPITALIFFMISVYLVETLLILVVNMTKPCFIRDISSKLYGRIFLNDSKFFVDNSGGQIESKVSVINQKFLPLTLEFWANVFGLMLGFIILIATLRNINFNIMILVMLGGAFRVAWSILMQGRVNRGGKDVADANAEVNGMQIDSVSNGLAVKIFAAEKSENAAVLNKRNVWVKLIRKLFWLKTMREEPMELSLIGIAIACVFLSIRAVSNGTMGVSDAVFVIVSIQTIYPMFSKIVRLFMTYSEDRAVAGHSYNQIIRPILVADSPSARNLKISESEIVFDAVSFDYGGRPIVKDFNLIINPSERVGIVGLSGAGKSTLANLILRMHDVKSGAIRIDGQDIRDVRQDSLRGQIAFVSQDSDLFNRTLMDNIRFGRPNAIRAAVIAAARSANVHDFIMETPNGYDTLVGNRGIKLSGGQRQRIAIARAFLKNAPILILDEATSALDSQTEDIIQKSFAKLMRGRTTIAIAHRLSTLRNMDKIVVMDKGRVVEIGTHAQLVRKRGGVYAKLWKMQSGGFV